MILPLLLALSAPVESTGKLVLTYGGASLADLASTEWALVHGAAESNPLLKERAVRIGVSLAAAGLTTWGTRKLQRDGHPRGARIVKWTYIGLRGIAVFVHVRKATR